MFQRCFRVSFVLAAFCLFCFCPTAGAADVAAKMSQADALWPERLDLEKTKASIALYQEILAEAPENVEAMWKITRAYHWLGTKIEDKDQQVPTLEKGIAFAEKAVSLKPDCVACHYWLGVIYGEYGRTKGVLKSLSLVGPIKEQMNEVIKLDPNFSNAGAYMVLGELYRAVPGIAGGSKKKSLEYLNKAVELAPNHAANRLSLAKTLLALKKKDEAKQELEWILKATDTGPLGNRGDKKKAEQLLKENF